MLIRGRMLFTNGGLLHGLLRSLWHPQILFLYLMYHSHRALPKMQIWPCHFSQTIFGFPLTPVMCPNWSLQPHLSTLSSSPCKLLWNAVCSLTTSAFAPAVPFPERSHHTPSHLTESSPTFPDVLSNVGHSLCPDLSRSPRYTVQRKHRWGGVCIVS